MSFAVQVDAAGGLFTATLLGAPAVSAVGPTRDDAVAALQSQIDKRVATGQLLTIDIPKIGPLALAGTLADDPWLAEICEEAYRLRDQEPRE